MYLSLYLWALLNFIDILYCAINMVMGVIFYFSFVLYLLLTNISPLWVCLRVEQIKWVSLICSCINAKSMWPMDDSPWSCSDFFMVFTGHACCTWLVCCLLGQIFPANFTLVHYIMGCIAFLNFTLPTLGRWALAHLCSPGSVHRVLLVGIRHFSGYGLHKNVLQSPWFFNLLTYVFLWCYVGAAYNIYV